MARDSARQAKEIELKLEFDPADAARLASHPALRAGPAPQEEHQLISTYFDTPDCALHKAGVYLRVRENDGHIVQTIKTAKSETDLIERLEWEREITSRNPDLDGVDDTPLKPLLTAGVRAALRPMFETQIRRHVFRILRDGSEIEVAIDQGEIATKTGMQAISELELELKRGKTKELFRLARVLGRTVPLRLEVKSKAERGYALLKGGSLQVEKAAEIDIPPNMSAEEAFRAIARSCVRQLVANEPILFAGRAEGLHQMRIGLRRLRASIAIFADVVGDETEKKIKTELKWITQELGPARDLDVFAAEVLEPLRASHPSDAGLTLTQRNFEAKRKEAYRRATSAVRSDRFRAAVLDLVAWVETGDWGSAGGEHRKATQDAGRRRACQGGTVKASQAHQAQGLRHSPSERHAAAQIAHSCQAVALRDRILCRHVSGRGERQAETGLARCAQGCAGCSWRPQRSRHATRADRRRPRGRRRAGRTRRRAGRPRRGRHRRDLAAQSRASFRAVCRDQPFLEGVRGLSLRRAAGLRAS